MKLFFILFLFLNSTVFAMETANTKQTILEEFKKKLAEEEELQRELKKNKTLTNEDLDGLAEGNNVTIKDILDSAKKNEEEIKFEKELEEQRKKEIEAQRERREAEKKRQEEEQKRIEEEEKKIAEEEKKLKEEEERIKKEEAEAARDAKNQKRKEQLEKAKNSLKEKLEQLTKRKDTLLQDVNKLTQDMQETNDKIIETDNIAEGKTPKRPEKSGVIGKVFNITDTGVSEEFLYTEEYRELVNNRTNISKVDINKESDIPVIELKEKDIITFDTSDIPAELLAYYRSTQNRHIPTIMSDADMQQIAMSAIEKNDQAVLRGVIEQTKDPDFLVDKNRTLLNYAIENKNYALSRYLIYSGASINKIDKKGNNPLHISVSNHTPEISDLLVDNGVDINYQNIDGDTPLLLSIKTNQDDLAMDLIKKGADLKIKNNAGDDALNLCIKNNKRKLQQYIREIIRREEAEK